MQGWEYQFRVGSTEYTLDRIKISEWEDAQEITGLAITQFNTGVILMNPKCLRALVWLARRRQDPQLRYSDVEFTLDEFDEVIPEQPDAPEGEPPAEGKAPSPDGSTSPAESGTSG